MIVDYRAHVAKKLNACTHWKIPEPATCMQKNCRISECAQAAGEVLLAQSDGTGSLPAWQQTCGTYVGCMFVDYMSLLKNGYGFASTGPVMTGVHILPGPS